MICLLLWMIRQIFSEIIIDSDIENTIVEDNHKVGASLPSVTMNKPVGRQEN